MHRFRLHGVEMGRKHTPCLYAVQYRRCGMGRPAGIKERLLRPCGAHEVLKTQVSANINQYSLNPRSASDSSCRVCVAQDYPSFRTLF